MKIFAVPLGWIMKACYALVKNYGFALFIFTLITRLVILPIQIKQQKNSARIAMINPELERLRKKYSKNQEKLNEETMRLYTREGINPMSGCLPMIISMVILFSLIPVIYGPLTYVSDLDKDSVEKSNALITNLSTLCSEIDGKDTTIEKMLEGYEGSDEEKFEQFKKAVQDKDEYKTTNKTIDGESQWDRVFAAIEMHHDIDRFITDPKSVSQNLARSRPELVTFDFVNKADGKYADILPDDVREVAEDFKYEMFGLSLGEIPRVKSALVLIPLLSFILQIACSFVSQLFMKKNNPAAANMGGTMKVMLYVMPVFSLWISFSYPAGLGLYWIYSSLFALVQTIFLNVVYTPEHVQELVQKDIAKNKQKKKNGKKSFMERALEIQQEQQGKPPVRYDDDDDDEEDGGERKLSKAELKELQRKKLNEARRRMAEKYGDEYKED